MIQQVKTVGGYLNFFVDRTLFSKEIVAEVLKNDRFGASDEGKGKTVVLDYSSPILQSPFTLGICPPLFWAIPSTEFMSTWAIKAWESITWEIGVRSLAP